MDNKTQLEIANIILSQMGGTGRIKLMVGAKCFTYGLSELGNVCVGFKHMNGKDGINYTQVELMADDTYTMKFKRVFGSKVTDKGEREMVFFDDLIPVFREFTGLELIVPTIRGLNG